MNVGMQRRGAFLQQVGIKCLTKGSYDTREQQAREKNDFVHIRRYN